MNLDANVVASHEQVSFVTMAMPYDCFSASMRKGLISYAEPCLANQLVVVLEVPTRCKSLEKSKMPTLPWPT